MARRWFASLSALSARGVLLLLVAVVLCGTDSTLCSALSTAPCTRCCSTVRLGETASYYVAADDASNAQ